MFGEAVRRHARELGFDLVGIAPAERAPYGDAFTRFLRERFHGDMGYLERNVERRLDPREVVPGARSVVVVAMAYSGRRFPGVPVARYALGRDYHNVIGRRLKRFARFIREVEPGATTYASCDTGPVLERAWAERAGIGWIGRAGNLVTRTHASWVLLGSIIVDREASYDTPARSMCGTCNACVDACPTGAIVRPYIVDARRCISYLTIENRGEIPRDLRRAVGDHLFGCDVCQDACPWNKFGNHAPNPALLSAPATASAPDPDPVPDPASPLLPPFSSLSCSSSLCDSVVNPLFLSPPQILSLDESSFARIFAGSPLRRAGLAGLKRNALVILGNKVLSTSHA